MGKITRDLGLIKSRKAATNLTDRSYLPSQIPETHIEFVLFTGLFLLAGVII